MMISVITVVLNDLCGLKRTYESIKAQSSTEFEWIICDGGSNQETLDFLSSLECTVKWISEPDQGTYDAMNRGVSLSSGDYVVFMNAGDYFYNSDTIDLVCKNIMHTDILFGGAVLCFLNGRSTIYRPPRPPLTSIPHGLPANHQATYYKRSLLMQA